MSAREQVIESTGEIFAKFPPLSPRAREFFVKVAPAYAGIFGGLGFFIAILSFRALSYPGATQLIFIIGALNLISSLLLVVSTRFLMKKQKKGWELLFWSRIINSFSALVAFDLLGIAFSVASLYIAFQIRPHYK